MECKEVTTSGNASGATLAAYEWVATDWAVHTFESNTYSLAYSGICPAHGHSFHSEPCERARTTMALRMKKVKDAKEAHAKGQERRAASYAAATAAAPPPPKKGPRGL